MRTERILEDLLGQKSKVSILRLLLREEDLTGREIARRSGLSPRAAQKTLLDLHKKGIVAKKVAGASHLFSLKKDHYVVERMLSPLFVKEQELFKALIEELMKRLPGKGVLSVVVFGSTARGDSRYGSDLDVLIVTNNSASKKRIADTVREHNDEFYRKFGMPISPYVVPVGDLGRRFDKKDKLIRNIFEEGLTVWGKPLGEVVAIDSKNIPH